MSKTKEIKKNLIDNNDLNNNSKNNSQNLGFNGFNLDIGDISSDILKKIGNVPIFSNIFNEVNSLSDSLTRVLDLEGNFNDIEECVQNSISKDLRFINNIIPTVSNQFKTFESTIQEHINGSDKYEKINLEFLSEIPSFSEGWNLEHLFPNNFQRNTGLSTSNLKDHILSITHIIENIHVPKFINDDISKIYNKIKTNIKNIKTKMNTIDNIAHDEIKIILLTVDFIKKDVQFIKDIILNVCSIFKLDIGGHVGGTAGAAVANGNVAVKSTLISVGKIIYSIVSMIFLDIILTLDQVGLILKYSL